MKIRHIKLDLQQRIKLCIRMNVWSTWERGSNRRWNPYSGKLRTRSKLSGSWWPPISITFCLLSTQFQSSSATLNNGWDSFCHRRPTMQSAFASHQSHMKIKHRSLDLTKNISPLHKLHIFLQQDIQRESNIHVEPIRFRSKLSSNFQIPLKLLR